MQDLMDGLKELAKALITLAILLLFFSPAGNQ